MSTASRKPQCHSAVDIRADPFDASVNDLAEEAEDEEDGGKKSRRRKREGPLRGGCLGAAMVKN